ncbi:DUF262 domain-containing protein [Pontibacterium sp.]|uniref:DUF262 domain-containing protein n=1 Tax=Pontibacterium sp. TaxID=2036026 RepID=UPI0035168104
MDVKPNYCSIESVFSDSNTFIVPRYQRAYSWRKENHIEYADDLLSLYDKHQNNNKEAEHFFGGIVCVKVENDNPLDDKSIYQLVDGQQRLSTTVLLVSRMVEAIDKLVGDAEFNELRLRRIAKYESKFIEIVSEENNAEIRYPRVSMSARDYEFYDSHVRSRAAAEPVATSHKLLMEASDYFDKWLVENFINSEDSMKSLSNIDVLYRVLSKSCKFLLIKMSDVMDAYRLFQVINDRGRSLTAGDLLRASSLGEIANSNLAELELERSEKAWDFITSRGSSETDTLLTNYLIANTGKSQRKSALVENFSKEFFSDKTSIPEEIRKLEEGINTLVSLSEGRWPYDSNKISDVRKAKLHSLMVVLGHKHALPFLLAATKLSEKKFAEVVFYLEKFFFVYKTALGKRVTPLSNLYYRQIKWINNEGNNLSDYQPKIFFSELYAILEKVSAFEVVEYLNSLRYEKDGNNKGLKFVLSLLEENYEWVVNKKTRRGLDLYLIP